MTDNITTVKYQDWDLNVQTLPDGKTVINLLYHPLKLNDLIIESQPEDNDVLYFVNSVDCFSDQNRYNINGFSILCNRLTSNWIDFFRNGLLDLADYIVVGCELLHIISHMGSDIKNLHKLVAPVGYDSPCEDIIIVDAFQTWHTNEVVTND